ncbi:MAG: hypothetical protein HC913_10685 [Microscillaceae bacterium]|nr:hypothetical protein [Microscillaceae bacterium]
MKIFQKTFFILIFMMAPGLKGQAQTQWMMGKLQLKDGSTHSGWLAFEPTQSPDKATISFKTEADTHPAQMYSASQITALQYYDEQLKIRRFYGQYQGGLYELLANNHPDLHLLMTSNLSINAQLKKHTYRQFYFWYKGQIIPVKDFYGQWQEMAQAAGLDAEALAQKIDLDAHQPENFPVWVYALNQERSKREAVSVR